MVTCNYYSAYIGKNSNSEYVLTQNDDYIRDLRFHYYVE